MSSRFWIFLVIFVTLFAGAAYSYVPSPVSQSGSVTTGHLTSWSSANTVQDSGLAVTAIGSSAPLNLGTSASATNPHISGDLTTGLYTAGAGKVDVSVSGGNEIEFNASGISIATGDTYKINGTQITCAALSNSVASCSTDATVASNISSGTLPAARLPLPAIASLGGVFSKAAVSHNFLTAISSVDGSITQAQPAVGDISGFGTGVATALGNALNGASGLVGVSGALGTPTSGTLTNATGLPIAGVTGWGTGVATLVGGTSSGTGGPAGTISPTFTGTVVAAAETLSGTLTTNVTGSTQCLHVNTSGVVTGTGSDCGSGGGSGTVASSTIGQVPVYTGATTVTGGANFTISGGALTLGVSGTAGSVAMGNATSGVLTLQPQTGALGTVTVSIPAATDTLVNLAGTQTLSNKTLAAPAMTGTATAVNLTVSGTCTGCGGGSVPAYIPPAAVESLLASYGGL